MGKVLGHGKDKFKVEPAKRTTLTLSTTKQPRRPWRVGHHTLLTNLALKTLEEKKFAKCPVSLCMREFLELPPLDIWKLVETIRNMGSLFQHGSENREERDSDKSGFLKWLVEGIFFNKLMMWHHLSNLLSSN